MRGGGGNRSALVQNYGKRAFYDRVGAAVRLARTDAGMSRKGLAVALGISEGTLANVEAGMNCPLHLAASIAEILDTTIDALVPLEASA